MWTSIPRVLVSGSCALLLGTSAASAQQTSTATETRTFEVVAVDGNTLLVREASGTKEYTVPESFRFAVGGKRLSVHELKPGMKGSATITTTTTVVPVTLTEVKEGTVMRALGNAVIVRGPTGIHMFSPGEISKRNIRIFRGGRPVDLSELREGDRLTATFVTEQPPKVLTEQEVKAAITAASGPPAASSAPVPAATTPLRAAEPAPVPVSPAPTEPASTAAPESHSQATSGLGWAILGVIALVVALVVVVRRKGSAA